MARGEIGKDTVLGAYRRKRDILRADTVGSAERLSQPSPVGSSNSLVVARQKYERCNWLIKKQGFELRLPLGIKAIRAHTDKQTDSDYAHNDVPASNFPVRDERKDQSILIGIQWKMEKCLAALQFEQFMAVFDLQV